MSTKTDYWNNLRRNVAKMRILDDATTGTDSRVALNGYEDAGRIAAGVEYDLARIADELAAFREKHGVTDHRLDSSSLIDATARIYSPR